MTQSRIDSSPSLPVQFPFGPTARTSADLRRIDTDIQRLVEAVTAGGGSAPALVDAMKGKQRARDAVAGRLTQLQQRAAESDWYVMAPTDNLVVDLEETLSNDPETARGVLRSLPTTQRAIRPRASCSTSEPRHGSTAYSPAG
jgi:hypothetical protein